HLPNRCEPGSERSRSECVAMPQTPSCHSYRRAPIGHEHASHNDRYSACKSARVRIRDLNWMQLEEYLQRDDRIVLPVGSTEQHAYLSLETDNIIAERGSAEAAEPLGIPVLP